jgi:hypothetical protein
MGIFGSVLRGGQLFGDLVSGFSQFAAMQEQNRWKNKALNRIDPVAGTVRRELGEHTDTLNKELTTNFDRNYTSQKDNLRQFAHQYFGNADMAGIDPVTGAMTKATYGDFQRLGKQYFDEIDADRKVVQQDYDDLLKRSDSQIREFLQGKSEAFKLLEEKGDAAMENLAAREAYEIASQTAGDWTAMDQDVAKVEAMFANADPNDPNVQLKKQAALKQANAKGRQGIALKSGTIQQRITELGANVKTAIMQATGALSSSYAQAEGGLRSSLQTAATTAMGMKNQILQGYNQMKGAWHGLEAEAMGKARTFDATMARDYVNALNGLERERTSNESYRAATIANMANSGTALWANLEQSVGAMMMGVQYDVMDWGAMFEGSINTTLNYQQLALQRESIDAQREGAIWNFAGNALGGSGVQYVHEKQA